MSDTIYARVYSWDKVHPYENTLLLDAFVAHPAFLTYPTSPDNARLVGATVLTDPNHLIWSTYRGTEITGVMILTRIVPRVDALLHFMFLDRDLVSKRTLLRNLIGYCFTDLGFQRLSMEVPDRVVRLKDNDRSLAVGTRMERFARKVLGFRLEGETRDRHHELPDSLHNDWVARQGSRRERSYFDGTKWSDIVLLRLLASEWMGEQGGNQCHFQQSSEQPLLSSDPPSVASSEAAGPVTPNPSSPGTFSP